MSVKNLFQKLLKKIPMALKWCIWKWFTNNKRLKFLGSHLSIHMITGISYDSYRYIIFFFLVQACLYAYSKTFLCSLESYMQHGSCNFYTIFAFLWSICWSYQWFILIYNIFLLSTGMLLSIFWWKDRNPAGR